MLGLTFVSIVSFVLMSGDVLARPRACVTSRPFLPLVC